MHYTVRALLIGMGVLLLPACDKFKTAAPSEELFHEWVVFLESDFTLGPRHVRTVGGGTDVSDAERCGDKKVDTIWSIADGLITEAVRDRATIELIANVSPVPALLTRTAFNVNAPSVRAIQEGPGTPFAKDEMMKSEIATLQEAARNKGRDMYLQALQTPQPVQDLFQAVEVLRGTLSERFHRSSKIIVVFVSDMVHYNTSTTNQFSAREGFLNMILPEDRKALAELRSKTPEWWINDQRLAVPSHTNELEIRVIPVERCSEGEILPRTAAANWTLIHQDAQTFWTATFRLLGAKDVRWNYSTF